MADMTLCIGYYAITCLVGVGVLLARSEAFILMVRGKAPLLAKTRETGHPRSVQRQ